MSDRVVGNTLDGVIVTKDKDIQNTKSVDGVHTTEDALILT